MGMAVPPGNPPGAASEPPGAVTVITDDCSYSLKADGWRVDTIGQLDVTEDDETVASFAPTKWIGIWKASTGATP